MTRPRFDRHELAGAFGDIGTDLPLIVALIGATDLNGATVLIVFGALQILTGIVYGLPMPMQPLKAMAATMIAASAAGSPISGDVYRAGGLAIGLVMLVLSLSGGLNWLTRAIPACVVRGIQFGLGLTLATLATGTYLPKLGAEGYALAVLCAVVIIALWGNRRVPAAPIVILLGLGYALWRTLELGELEFFKSAPQFGGLALKPRAVVGRALTPRAAAVAAVAFECGHRDGTNGQRFLPGETRYGQPNRRDLRGDEHYRRVRWRNPGVPRLRRARRALCLRRRTGGSVMIYGSLYVLLGLVLGESVETFVAAFPLPVLGVMLLFESVAIMRLVRHVAHDQKELDHRAVGWRRRGGDSKVRVLGGIDRWRARVVRMAKQT